MEGKMQPGGLASRPLESGCRINIGDGGMFRCG